MTKSKTSKRYPAEVRERAVRLVLEHRDEYETKWAAITSTAAKFGMSGEMLRGWVLGGSAPSACASVWNDPRRREHGASHTGLAD